jgi:spore coat polysaccharide biosynthesis protein SpsF
MAINGAKVVAVIEARMTSSRLPGKVIMPAGGQPLLAVLIERLRRVSRIDQIVVATTVNATDDSIVAVAREAGAGWFRGSEEDVLERVCGCLRANQAEICVEITGDCPLVDPAIVDEMLDAYASQSAQHFYFSNSDPHRSVPAGLDVQVFATSALYELDRETTDPADREHVSYGLYRPESGDRWKPLFIKHPAAAGGEEMMVTLDYREDYELIKALHEDLSQRTPQYGAGDIIDWIRAHPEIHEPCLRVRLEEA